MLEEKILNDYKDAMKSRDSLKTSVLSCLRAEFMNAAIAKKKDKLDDNDIIGIIKKQMKQRDDSIEAFTKGNRPELADKEKKELDLLKVYLPAQMSAEEVRKVVDGVIASTGAVSIKDMGKVMKEVNTIVAGKADGKLISDLVRQKLSPEPKKE
jgi:hypothetical protein